MISSTIGIASQINKADPTKIIMHCDFWGLRKISIPDGYGNKTTVNFTSWLGFFRTVKSVEINDVELVSLQWSHKQVIGDIAREKFHLGYDI